MKKITAVQVLKFTAILIPATYLSSCAHHRDVRPGSEGVHRVLTHDQERSRSERNALQQAEHFCKEQGKYAAIIKEETKYTGSMDEATRDTLRKASTAAIILGGSAGANGDPSPVRTAGQVGGIMTSGDDYVTEMSFRCN